MGFKHQVSDSDLCYEFRNNEIIAEILIIVSNFMIYICTIKIYTEQNIKLHFDKMT
jgi:hypothetical protein